MLLLGGLTEAGHERAQPFIDKDLHCELKRRGKNAPLQQAARYRKGNTRINTDEETIVARDIFLQ